MDQFITVYDEPNVHLSGEIKAGCLHLESDVYGDDYDSEKHYSFTREETEKLFETITLEEFIALCREKHLIGMEEFLNNAGITYKTFSF